MKVKNRRNISVKWKIFSFLLGFCGLLLIILWLFQTVFLESFYEHIKINDIKSAASTILKNLDNKDLPELVNRISESNDVCVEILTKNGKEVYSSDILRDCIIHKQTSYEKALLLIQTVEKGGELLQILDRRSPVKLETQPSQSFNDDIIISDIKIFPGFTIPQSIVYVKVFTTDENEVIAVMLNSVITPVNSTVNTLRVQLYYITAIMLIFSVILAFIIARNVSKPIVNINQSAKKLATGDFDTQFDDKGYKEITELADTLNFAAKELSKVEKLRRELIANISHDLRTPLTLISGYAEIMRDLPEENNAENAQIIVDESRRLTHLVNDVLDISKSEAGIQQMDMRKYNLTQSIKNTVDRMRELLKNENFTIIFEYSRETHVFADENKISQAFYNLLSNGINYSGEDKTVIVRQWDYEDSVRIEVIDTGEGIAQESLPYIWDRYYKVDKTHKRAITGSGLGLSIVKQIIQNHNGLYGVASQPGKGSVFWFVLKRCED